MAAGDGQWRPGRDDPGQVVGLGSLGVPPVHHVEATVTEIAHGGHPGGELCLQGRGDDLVDLGVRVTLDAVEGIEARVGHQMRVRLDQAGQDRRVAVVGEGAVRGHVVRRRLDADDPPVIHEHGRSLVEETVTVEGASSPDREHTAIQGHSHA